MRISDWSSDVCSPDLSTSTTPCDPSASYGGTRDAAKSPRNAGGRCARKKHSGSRIWHRDQVAPPETRHRRRVSTHDPAQRSHARRKIKAEPQTPRVPSPERNSEPEGTRVSPTVPPTDPPTRKKN